MTGDPMTDDEASLREAAERRAAARMSVQAHLLTYVLVNAGLIGLDWFVDGRVDWAFWSLFGWGIGLVAHAVSVSYSLSGAHERTVEREMERLRRRQRGG